MNQLDQIRAEAVKTALSYGLDPNTFSVVWDKGPAIAGPNTRYAIPAGTYTTKEKINKITQKHYPLDQHKEEAQVRAFEILSKEAPKTLWENLLKAISQAWNKITNKDSLPKEVEQKLIGEVLQKGIGKTKAALPNKKTKPQPALT